MQCLCLGRIIVSLLTCLGNQVLLLNSVSRNKMEQCSGKMCVIMRYIIIIIVLLILLKLHL